MVPPLRTALTRATRSTLSVTQSQLRLYSSQPPSQRQPSPTGAFYKTFTRPVAKCALLAVFVYQLVYFGWTKLETDEIRRERQAEIRRLETQARALHAAHTAAQAAQETTSATLSGSQGGADKEVGKSAGSWWRWK